MSDNTQVVENTPAPEAVTPEPVETPNSEVTPKEGEAKPQPTEEKKWNPQRRIDALTREKYQARAEADFLKQRLEQLERQSQPPEETEGQVDPKAIQQQVMTAAEQIATRKELANRFNRAVQEGTKSYADFNSAVDDLLMVAGESPSFPLALAETDAPQEIMYYLGKNLDEAERIASLSPIAMARALTKIEAKIESEKKNKTSAAPKPLEPVKGQSSDNALRDDIPMEEWLRRRNEQLRKK